MEYFIFYIIWELSCNQKFLWRINFFKFERIQVKRRKQFYSIINEITNEFYFFLFYITVVDSSVGVVGSGFEVGSGRPVVGEPVVSGFGAFVVWRFGVEGTEIGELGVWGADVDGTDVEAAGVDGAGLDDCIGPLFTL